MIKKLLSNITGETFRWGKVTKCFSPTKFSPIRYTGQANKKKKEMMMTLVRILEIMIEIRVLNSDSSITQ